MTEIDKKYSDYWYKNDVTNPKISIIVPAYNVEKYIEKCLASLVKQTFKDFEVLIINDGSKDSTPEIANEFTNCDGRFKLISQENQGLSGARNTGVKNAGAQYITFLDSDDCVSSNYLELLYNAITKNNCDIAIAEMIRKRKHSEKYRLHFKSENVYTELQDKINICRIPVCCYVCGKLFKTELIRNNPFKMGVYFEDVIWLPEILKKSNKIIVVPNSSYYYNVNPNSIVKTKQSAKKQYDSYNAKKYIIEFFKQNNLELNEKSKHVTKYIKYLFNIPVLKIKEYNNVETSYLFSIFPIFKRKNQNTANN